jgi:hypothetical protein
MREGSREAVRRNFTVLYSIKQQPLIEKISGCCLWLGQATTRQPPVYGTQLPPSEVQKLRHILDLFHNSQMWQTMIR